MAPERPQDPREFTPLMNDVLRRLREVERHRHPLQDIPDIPGAAGGKEYATVVVAAVDTHESGKTPADFICTGADDQTTLVAALAALPANGGKILLLEGQYEFSATFMITKPYTTLQGMGRSTIINAPATADGSHPIRIFADYVVVSNLRIVCNALHAHGLVVEGNNAIVSEVDVSDPLNNGIETNSDVENLIVTSCGVNGAGANGFNIETDHTTISGCLAINCLTGFFSSTGNESAISNCIARGGVTGFDLSAVSRVAVTGCVAVDQSTYSMDLGDQSVISGCFVNKKIRIGASLTGAGETQLLGCRIRNVSGNCLEIAPNGDRSVIKGNYISGDATGNHGIFINGADDCIVQGNTIYQAGRQTNATYDGIHLTNSDRANVQGNTIRHGGLANKIRYGINVATATCNDCLVTNNDLLTSGVTGSLNDTGTGTITVAGNRL